MQWDTLVADSRKVCNVLRCCVTFNALNMANVIGYYITDLQKYLALTKITVTIIFLLLFFFALQNMCINLFVSIYDLIPCNVYIALEEHKFYFCLFWTHRSLCPLTFFSQRPQMKYILTTCFVVTNFSLTQCFVKHQHKTNVEECRML